MQHLSVTVNDLMRKWTEQNGQPEVNPTPGTSKPDFKKCQYCGCSNLVFEYQIFSNQTVHLRCECDTCGRVIGWAPQIDEFTKQAKG